MLPAMPAPLLLAVASTATPIKRTSGTGPVVLHHPYALLGGFVLALVAMAVTVKPPKHPRVKSALAIACWVAAVGLFVWGFVPLTLLRWLGVCLAVLVVLALIALVLSRYFDFRSPLVRRAVEPSRLPAAMGRVDFELYSHQASEGLARVLSAMGKEMERNTARITKAAPRIAKAASSSVERRHKLLAKTAAGISNHAHRMEVFEAEYRSQIQTFVTHSKHYVESLDASELPQLTQSTLEFRASAESSKAGTSSYRESIQGTRNLNLSQAVNGAAEDLFRVLDHIIGDTDKILAYCDWVAEFARAHATNN